ncbi:MAG: septum formation protein Maf [Akkermansiaceae bacterium]|nr:septum formation protein Maf [Akkermansiaceae bacterium]NNM30298.1 septum formation protein Maf [Akkermansiaceae bacterium]
MGRPLILASGSQRRKDLLESAGFAFEVVPPEVEELEPGTFPFRKLCAANAALKARAVRARHPEAVVLGADTMVGLGGRVLGKPASMAEAMEMLASLAGRAHEVCTGVCLAGPEEECVFFEVTWVRFRKIGREVINEYLERVEVLDKAGAYAIQEHGDMLVDKIEGEYDNVVGLPVTRVCAELERLGVRREEA